jgi:hypothetical protein
MRRKRWSRSRAEALERQAETVLLNRPSREAENRLKRAVERQEASHFVPLRGHRACASCGKHVELVCVVDGLLKSGVPNVMTFCGHQCCAAAGYPWAGLPSRFRWSDRTVSIK